MKHNYEIYQNFKLTFNNTFFHNLTTKLQYFKKLCLIKKFKK